MSLFLTIQGEPVAKGRPRMTKTGHCYTPAGTRKNALVSACRAEEQMRGQNVSEPLSGPLSLDISYFLPRPKSVKREFPTVKPDIDNFVKQTLDYLNGVAFVDDSQVVKVVAEKAYSGEPRTVIVVNRLGAA